jgi:Glycosyltransferase family 17
MPRVFDCVILENENQLDLLEARFCELKDIPEVTWVVCEAEADYHGDPKPAFFRDDPRFTPFRGRWNHVTVAADEMSPGEPRERKNALRDILCHGFNGEPADIVMHGNIDEIPAEWMVKRLAAGESELPVTFSMRWCSSQAGLVRPEPWPGTAAHQRQHIGSFSGLRRRRKELPLVITAGTRLSLMGEPPEEGLWKKEIDDSWPRYITEGWCPAEWLSQEAGESRPQLLIS